MLTEKFTAVKNSIYSPQVSVLMLMSVPSFKEVSLVCRLLALQSNVSSRSELKRNDISNVRLYWLCVSTSTVRWSDLYQRGETETKLQNQKWEFVKAKAIRAHRELEVDYWNDWLIVKASNPYFFMSSINLSKYQANFKEQ